MLKTMETLLRNATEFDATEMSLLINRAYRGDDARLGWTYESDLVGGERVDPSGVKDLIRQKNSVFILALENNKIVGCVHTTEESPDRTYFGMLAVEPRLQGKGLGKKLIQEVERRTRERGAREVRITVIELRYELIVAYEKLGYQSTGASFEFPMSQHLKIPGLRLLEYLKTL